jgi:hypothetical protein
MLWREVLALLRGSHEESARVNIVTSTGREGAFLVEHDIGMPVRTPGGAGKGELEWRSANPPSLHNLFVNPIYAGIYVYGVRAIDRRRQKPGRPGTGRRPPRAGEAEVFLPDRVPAYITREQFERNQAQLRANRADRLDPVRAGSALLSGLLVCGQCGLRMMAFTTMTATRPATHVAASM